VLRGGSWNNNVRNCRISNRNNNTPGNSNNNIGFRLVLVPAHRHGRIAATEQTAALCMKHFHAKNMTILAVGGLI